MTPADCFATRRSASVLLGQLPDRLLRFRLVNVFRDQLPVERGVDYAVSLV